MGNCVFSDKPEPEKENQKLYKEILKELQERKNYAANYIKNKTTKHKPKFSKSRTNKFFDEEPNIIQFKSLENTTDTFYTGSIGGGFTKNLFYPNSSSQFQQTERKFSSHSRNNSRISANRELALKFSVSSSSGFQGGKRLNFSPNLRINKENSYNSNFIVRMSKKSNSVCRIKDI